LDQAAPLMQSDSSNARKMGSLAFRLPQSPLGNPLQNLFQLTTLLDTSDHFRVYRPRADRLHIHPLRSEAQRLSQSYNSAF